MVWFKAAGASGQGVYLIYNERRNKEIKNKYLSPTVGIILVVSHKRQQALSQLIKPEYERTVIRTNGLDKSLYSQSSKSAEDSTARSTSSGSDAKKSMPVMRSTSSTVFT